MKYRTWLGQQLTDLQRLEGHPEFTEQVADDVRETIREAGHRADLAGIPEAVALCDIREGGLSPTAGRAILAACLAACGVESSGDYLGLPDAARMLGCSESGLRKLVRRGAIQFSQQHKHAAIRFRRTWLEAYVSPTTARKKVKPAPKREVMNLPASHGFDPALLR